MRVPRAGIQQESAILNASLTSTLSSTTNPKSDLITASPGPTVASYGFFTPSPTISENVATNSTTATASASVSAYPSTSHTRINVVIGISAALGGSIFLASVILAVILCRRPRRLSASLRARTEKVIRVSDTSSSLCQEPAKKNYADICQLLDDALESRHSLVTPSPATPMFPESAPMLELPILEKHAPPARAVVSSKPQPASSSFPPPPLAPNCANSKRYARSASASRGRSARPTQALETTLQETIFSVRNEVDV